MNHLWKGIYASGALAGIILLVYVSGTAEILEGVYEKYAVQRFPEYSSILPSVVFGLSAIWLFPLGKFRTSYVNAILVLLVRLDLSIRVFMMPQSAPFIIAAAWLILPVHFWRRRRLGIREGSANYSFFSGHSRTSALLYTSYFLGLVTIFHLFQPLFLSCIAAGGAAATGSGTGDLANCAWMVYWNGIGEWPVPRTFSVLIIPLLLLLIWFFPFKYPYDYSKTKAAVARLGWSWFVLLAPTYSVFLLPIFIHGHVAGLHSVWKSKRNSKQEVAFQRRMDQRREKQTAERK